MFEQVKKILRMSIGYGGVFDHACKVIGQKSYKKFRMFL